MTDYYEDDELTIEDDFNLHHEAHRDEFIESINEEISRAKDFYDGYIDDW